MAEFIPKQYKKEQFTIRMEWSRICLLRWMNFLHGII